MAKVREAERRARTAERMAVIGSMTAGLAHEIKNPLSTIGLNAQLLEEAIAELPLDESLASRVRSRIKAMRREADRLRDILADFLAFAGNIRVEAVEVNLNQLIEELADFFTPEAQRHGVRVRVEHPQSDVIAVVDPRLIKQAVLNLMLNAVQAIAAAKADRGETASSATRAPAGELIIRLERGDERSAGNARAGSARTGAARPRSSSHAGPDVRIHVIDTGPGIDPETRQRMFNPYFTTKAGGSGLGLPTARRLIEEHGGSIDVHSQPGYGSDFVISIPVHHTRNERVR
jgi:signal transduction histidine kinase